MKTAVRITKQAEIIFYPFNQNNALKPSACGNTAGIKQEKAAANAHTPIDEDVSLHSLLINAHTRPIMQAADARDAYLTAIYCIIVIYSG